MKKIKYIFGGIFILCLSFILTSCISSTPTKTKYKIKYHTNTIPSVIEMEYDENTLLKEDMLPEVTSIEDYIAEHWYLESDFTTKVVFPYTITHNQDFYLKWIPQDTQNQYTVNFYVENQLYHTETINEGLTVSSPKEPTKEDTFFEGWLLNDTLFDFTTPITQNINLHASFSTVPVYQISFVADDVSIPVQRIKENGVIEKPTPAKEGYTFIGWFEDELFKTPFDFTTKIKKDYTLYAKFEINHYIVKFYNSETLFSTQETEYNQPALLPTNNPSKEGHTFKGWSSNKDTYTAFDFTTKIKKDTDLYAFFDIDTYTIEIYDGETKLETQTINYGDTVSSLPNPAKTGYTFKGWYIDKNCTTAFSKTTPIKKDYTLYAKFELNSYTIQFFNGSNVVKSQKVNHGDTITSPALNLDKEGYTFKGWSSNPSTYTAFNFEKPVTGNTNLYAFFDINTYLVSFYVDDTLYSTKTINYNTAVQEPEPPTKTNHTFVGWFESVTSNTPFDFKTSIQSELNLYAKFKETVTYLVLFEVDNQEYDRQMVVENTAAKQPTAPTKDGYSFIGWYYNEEVFNFNTKITESITLTAKFEESVLTITSFGGYNEGAYIEFEKLANSNLEDYTFSYKKENTTSFTTVDHQLIREKDGIIRCDVVGLPHGNYTLKIDITLDKPLTQTKEVIVYEDDRSGYAHFNYSKGVGAYNDDGSLKSNAVVVYVTDETKNTVKAKLGGKEYTGLVNIIQACTSSSYALDIRILGEIQTTQWNKKSHGTGNTSTRQNNLENLFNYVGDSSGWDEKSSSNYSKLNESGIISKGINSMSNDEAKGITKLNGLTNQVLRNKKADSKTGAYEYDSYYNMLDVSKAYNITVEGIGTDAAIFQWGFAFKQCNSIEIKNLRFYNYTEDAVGFEGGSSSNNDFGNYWIHNCTFDIGVNNWDVCYEADKGDGDGSSDVKYCHNVTISYTQYNGTHKTNLIGSSDSALQYNITLHHNFYNKCGSRLPLVRQTNLHMYNNYYYGSTSYSSSIRANCYAFVENCYYEGGKNPYETVSNGAIKAYNNYYDSSVSLSGSSYKKGNTVTSRTATVSNTCKPDGETDYSDFDTNSALFYYNTSKQSSDVSILTETQDVPAYCKTYSGVLKAIFTPKDDPSTNPDTPSYTVKFNTNGGNSLSDMTVKENTTLILPNNPTKTGYTFDGWYTNTALTNKFDAQTKITGDLTLYAKWKEKVAGTLNFDISQIPDSLLTADTSAGDFILTKDITIATSGTDKILKTGGNSDFKNNRRLIKFETTSSCTISVTFASQNSTATDRYVILYDSTGKEIGKSSTTLTGSAKSTYTFTISNAGTYSFGTYGGIIVYDIVVA